MGATRGETAYLFGAPGFIFRFSGVRVAYILQFSVQCYADNVGLFVVFLLAIVLSILWVTTSDYPFYIL